ncbi:MAG TPA: amidohydrolase family protein [Hyphomicrobiaceae bacterium]|nr:amidohydrolase family protein [Hyphomicrobiaceae bacterium]
MSTSRIDGGGRAPRLIAPPRACETHSHIYGTPQQYPHLSGRKPHVEARLEAYEALLARLGFERGVIVQPSLYGADNTCTLDAMRRMGAHRARGVAVTRKDVTPGELRALHDAGIRGLRFYFIVNDFDRVDLVPMANKVAELGWHVQVQDDGDWLVELEPVLKSLPTDVVIDHVGRTPAATGVADPNFRALLRLLETGKVWVKISAPYLQTTSGPPTYADVGDKVRAMVAVRPDRLVWAANWPHPNFAPDNKPEEADCLDPLLEWVPDEAMRNAILADNPAKLYDFGD